MADTLTDTDLGIDLDSLYEEQDPNEVAHIVKRSGDLGAGALVTAAAEAGIEVEALCGHRWVPKGYAPDHMDPCRRCIEIWQQITGGS